MSEINRALEITEKIKEENIKRLLPEAVCADKWLDKEMAKPDIIIEGLANKSSKGWVLGPSKSKKTWFVSQLALSIARGEQKFLKWNIPKRRKVLIIQFEVSEYDIHSRLNYTKKALNFKTSYKTLDDYLQIINARGCFDVTQSKIVLDEIEYYAKKYGSDVIIIDPIYKLLENESLPEKVILLCQAFDRICKNTSACVIGVHHYRKGVASESLKNDRASGSGIFARDYDFAFDIGVHKENGHDENLRVIETTVRNYPPIAPFTAEFKNYLFTVRNDISPDLQTRYDINKKQGLTDDEILSFFNTGAKPVTEFTSFLKNYFTVEQERETRRRLQEDGRIFSRQIFGGRKWVGLSEKQVENSVKNFRSVKTDEVSVLLEEKNCE